MPVFTFEAVDATGTRQRGSEDAADADVLARRLETRGLFLLHADAATPRASIFASGTRHEVLEFTRAMAALLPAGLPLARALESAGAMTSRHVRAAVLEARARVLRGETLAESLAAAPAVFPALYVGVIRASERRGELPQAFGQLAARLEREQQLRGRLLSALLYPALLAVAALMATTVLLFAVLPRFSALLTDAGAPVPRSTQLLLSLAGVLARGWPLLAMALVALTAWAFWQYRSEQGRRRLAQLLLALPLIGQLRRQVLGARFARLLATLLTGGAPLYNALADVIASLDDPVARDATSAIRSRVREGASLRTAVSEQPLFPLLLAQLIAVGEESSRLREFLLKAADILDERAERAAQRVATLVEPTLIVSLGAFVALVAFSLLQAIYSVNAGSFTR